MSNFYFTQLQHVKMSLYTKEANINTAETIRLLFCFMKIPGIFFNAIIVKMPAYFTASSFRFILLGNKEKCKNWISSFSVSGFRTKQKYRKSRKKLLLFLLIDERPI